MYVVCFSLQPLKEDKFVIPKSRYDTIDCYLASAEYNDQEVPYDKEVFQLLKDEGLDDLMAQHIAHLFIRDPISLFAEKLEQDVERETDHFEVSIQITVNIIYKDPSTKNRTTSLAKTLCLILATGKIV